MILNIVSFIVLLQFKSVLTINFNLSLIEENILYSRINSREKLNLFSTKLAQTIENNNQTYPDEFNKCFQSLNELHEYENVNRNDLERIVPNLIYVKLNNDCTKTNRRTSWKNVIIGLLTVTFINCSALCGAVILPFRKKPAFKWILSAFIGLAVGTLTGSGIFHLIPMAFNIPDIDTHHTYLNKSLVAVIIIYIFYMRDQILSIFFRIETIICTHDHGEHDDLIGRKNSKRSSIDFISKAIVREKPSHSLIKSLKTMKAAGWMIIIGDMLHNFIDGLTLGAAFTTSIGLGLRMSFPIICEEFPHELGDLAVLLSSGLTIGQALIMNFVSACSCYFGFILGAKLGELEQVHSWIYALAGGMFVYIGLTDMIPELVSMGDEIEKDYRENKKPVTALLKFKILLCQNIGLILGFVIMFLLGKYGEYLENFVKLSA